MTELKAYRVLDGVETVDGRRVPDDRIVRLTTLGAWFDLNAGKIVPLDESKPAESKNAESKPAESKTPIAAPSGGR
jgi:hypothetical protein